MIIACQRKMTNANILVQPLCLKTSQIIEYSNQESQNSLTQRIVPQLHCLRQTLVDHEAHKSSSCAILKFLTPSNIASMIIACQRKMTPANSNQEKRQNYNLKCQLFEKHEESFLNYVVSENSHFMRQKSSSSLS